MCNALCERLKCPAKVSCCFKCACNILLGVVAFIVILIVVGIVVYFAFFNNKNQGSPEATTESVKAFMSAVTPATFRDFFHKAQ